MSTALRSMFFNDNYYYADDFAESNKCTYSNGILPNIDYLKVTASSNMILSVASGRGWLQGHSFVNSSAAAITHANADGVLNRIDRIVVRLDTAKTNDQISIEVLSGTLATEPSAPSLTRDGTIYEIAIADVAIDAGTTEITQDMITDTRADVNLCGWAGAFSANDLDFDELRNSKADKTTVAELTTAVNSNTSNKADTSAITAGTLKASAEKLQATPISTTAPTEGQILKMVSGVLTPGDNTKTYVGEGTLAHSGEAQSISLGFTCMSYIAFVFNAGSSDQHHTIYIGSNTSAMSLIGHPTDSYTYTYLAIKE